MAVVSDAGNALPVEPKRGTKKVEVLCKSAAKLVWERDETDRYTAPWDGFQFSISPDEGQWFRWKRLNKPQCKRIAEFSSDSSRRRGKLLAGS
jgi:hypothetical protein